jgi:hypothetical protein
VKGGWVSCLFLFGTPALVDWSPVSFFVGGGLRFVFGDPPKVLDHGFFGEFASCKPSAGHSVA